MKKSYALEEIEKLLMKMKYETLCTLEEAFEIYNDLIKNYDKEILKNKNDYELLEKQVDLYMKINDKESTLQIYNKAIGLCLNV